MVVAPKRVGPRRHEADPDAPQPSGRVGPSDLNCHDASAES